MKPFCFLRSLPARGVLICLLTFGPASLAPAEEARTWTDLQGNTVTAEYMESNSQTVTLRLPSLKNIKVKIADLSEADKQYLTDLKEKARQANLISATIKGEIVVRVHNWSSLGWSNEQKAELWEWDAENNEPTTKVADVTVSFGLSHGSRDQFEGKFMTTEPVTVDKNARIIVLAKFNVSHNGEPKVVEDTSVPIQLPQMNADGEIKLPTVRATLR